MQVTIEISEIVAHKAEAAGLDVPTYLQRLIEKETLSSEGASRLVRFGPGPLTPAEAGADILDMRKRLKLGDVKIKELIEEGRRY